MTTQRQPMTWGKFLKVRQQLINEWRREGKSCTEIARTLSMDPGQVYLISTVDDHNQPAPEDARRSIIEVRDRAMRLFQEGRIK